MTAFCDNLIFNVHLFFQPVSTVLHSTIKNRTFYPSLLKRCSFFISINSTSKVLQVGTNVKKTVSSLKLLLKARSWHVLKLWSCSTPSLIFLLLATNGLPDPGSSSSFFSFRYITLSKSGAYITTSFHNFSAKFKIKWASYRIWCVRNMTYMAPISAVSWIYHEIWFPMEKLGMESWPSQTRALSLSGPPIIRVICGGGGRAFPFKFLCRKKST